MYVSNLRSPTLRMRLAIARRFSACFCTDFAATIDEAPVSAHRSLGAFPRRRRVLTLKTYLLTWSPPRYNWQRLPYLAHLSAQGWPVPHDWPCQNTKRIREGDRFFLLRKSPKPIGIMGSGFILSSIPYPARRDSSRGSARQRGTALFVDVNFDVLLDPDSDSILLQSRLGRGRLALIHWRQARSGIQIPEDAARELDAQWQRHLARIRWPGLRSEPYLPAGVSPTPKVLMSKSLRKHPSR